MGLYAVVSLAWPVLVLTLFPGKGAELSAVSSFYGTFDLTLVLCGWPCADNWLMWMAFWLGEEYSAFCGALACHTDHF